MNDKRLYHIIKTEKGYVHMCNSNNEVEFSPLRCDAVLFPFDITIVEYGFINNILHSNYKCCERDWLIEIK